MTVRQNGPPLTTKTGCCSQRSCSKWWCNWYGRSSRIGIDSHYLRPRVTLALQPSHAHKDSTLKYSAVWSMYQYVLQYVTWCAVQVPIQVTSCKPAVWGRWLFDANTHNCKLATPHWQQCPMQPKSGLHPRCNEDQQGGHRSPESVCKYSYLSIFESCLV